MALVPFEGCKPVIIKHQQVYFGNGCQQLEIAAVTLGQTQILKELGDAEVERAGPISAGFMGKRRRQDRICPRWWDR